MKTSNIFIISILTMFYCQAQPVEFGDNGWFHTGDAHFYNFPFDKSAVKQQSTQFFQLNSVELGLTVEDRMVFEREHTDNLGITHYRFNQIYHDIPVLGGGMILHGNADGIDKANGHIYSGINLIVLPTISPEEAIQVAKESCKGSNIQIEDISLIILPGKKEETYRSSHLCYRIHVHSDYLLEEFEVYVDAHRGDVVQRVSKICLGDEEGTAYTLFSGARVITADFSGGEYRLKESVRPIHTLNLNHAVDLGTVTEYTDDNNQWTDQITVLRQVTINTIGSGWWQDVPGDDDPDIYLVIKDGSNATVATTTTMMDVTLPVSIPLQLTLTNPPYSISIFEDDGGSNDWGGPFNVSTSLGMKSFSILGNMGTYETVQEADPALDAHWGVEQTYDYFKDVHNRNSYDDQGGEIVSYAHFAVGWPNAFWSNNSLKLGDGDGITTTYRTYINVVAHEISHGVINNNGGGGLQYQGESGALSESFADLFGTAVEHFAKPATADWLHGEEGSLIPGEYIRSMEDPRVKNQPDTYGTNDSFWADPLDIMVDFGGVHINSGVQNYWFYLLSEGGSGVNENGYAYIVDGIGLEKAEQIAYRNLTQYITASTTSNFMDSRMGSLMAAEDLYGSGSPEVIAVGKAWAAVGVGTFDPGPTCMGLVELTDPSGPIDDGSGMFEYGNNADCTWLINPMGVNSIQLDFFAFDLAPGDTLFVYDGGDSNAPALAVLSGNILPSSMTSSDGIIFIHFQTDGSEVSAGWSLEYSSSSMSYCGGMQVLTSGAGLLEDGSGLMSYGNLSDCSWLIQPQDATGITLSFTAMDTESGVDEVRVYDGPDANATLLGAYSGTQLPGALNASGGALFVHFQTNDLIRGEGWSAEYISTGPVPSCTGQQVLQGSSGTISDGSGSGPYGDNTDCSWLIEVDNANSISLTFSEFDLENGPDSVIVYDGADQFAPVLLQATGTTLPGTVSTTDSRLFVRFVTNESVTATGWSADYTSTFMTYCAGTQVMTDVEGDFSDGSGSDKYGNGTDCSWLIQPVNAKDITLSFAAFDTEGSYDSVTVYDGDNSGAPQLGSFSGPNLPPVIQSTGGSMFITFTSDDVVRLNGWSANYISSEITSILDPELDLELRIFPNPASGWITVKSPSRSQSSTLTIWNGLGQLLENMEIEAGRSEVMIDLSHQAPGFYQVQWVSGSSRRIGKVLLN